MLGNRELGFEDYLAIVRRRKWWIIIPTLVMPVVTFGISLLLPNIFTSQTLVLVEQQKVPEAYVKSVVTEELNQRLTTMQEQILSRSRLQPLIERYNLFPKKASAPMEEKVDLMRKQIEVSAVRGDFGGRTGGLPGFYISFTASDPRMAQQICAELTSMFMSENIRLREQNAVGTTEFIKTQLDDAKGKLTEQDSRLATFKKKYIGQLPGQEQTSFSMLSTLNTQLQTATQELAELQRQKTYAEAMLTQSVQTWESSRSLGQPTVTPQTLEQQLSSAEAQLVGLQGRYTDTHPDIVKVKRDIALLRQKIDEQNQIVPAPPKPEKDTKAAFAPPQIQQLRAQLRMIDDRSRDKQKEATQLQQQIKIYQARIQLSPVVEEEYKEITRDYQTALGFYNDLLRKKNDSEMATNLERRQQGEQFRVLDPANLPEKPTSPKRPVYAASGLGAGLGLGLLLALLMEMKDKSLRTEKGRPVLSGTAHIGPGALVGC